jgi:hypothetical protein
MSVEDLIKQYVTQITGKDDIDVEIIDDTVVLSRDERWHIYIIPGRFTMIGCFVDDDITISDILKKNAGSIQYIYETNKSDETVQ